MMVKKSVSEGASETSRDKQKRISRRDFVQQAGKLSGAFAAGLFCLSGSSRAAFGSGRTDAACRLSPVRMQLQFDEKACASCRLCEIACAQYHEGDADHGTARNRLIIRPLLRFVGLSALTANAPGWPQPLAVASYAEFSENHFCRQCVSPECLDACPEGAIFVADATGARVVDEEKCVGCGECVSACQFDMIRLNGETGKAFKCDLCGGEPQCVRWCPTGAITLKRF